MKEISVILKNNMLIDIKEFRILDRYSCFGGIWTLIHRPTPTNPCLVTYRVPEYIFEPETLTFFKIISENVFAEWDTNITKDLPLGTEYHLKDSFYIRQYSRH